MGAIRYRYGVDRQGIIVDIFDLKEKDRDAFTCLGCEKILIPVLPETVRQKHFRHKRGVECSQETYLHRAGKLFFEETYRGCLEKNEPFYVHYEVPHICKGCGLGPCEQKGVSRRFDLTSFFTTIQVEERDDGFIPDLILKTRKGDRLYIEIAVTHVSTFKKIESNVRIIEFYIGAEEDLDYLNRTELRYDDNFLRFYNFNPDPVVHSDRSACARDVDYFVVYKNGKCVIKSVKGAGFESIQKGPFLYVEKLRYTGSGVFISEIANALKKGVKVKNCYACRYHADAPYSLFKSKPIFCKTYKFKCYSNHAAECDRYRPDIKVFERPQDRENDVFLYNESYKKNRKPIKESPKPIPARTDEIYKPPETIICSKCGKSTKDWITLNPDVCSDCIYGR